MASTDPTDAAGTGDREMSLSPEEALLFAIELHKLDKFDDAELIYKALLERWPDHADVLSHMGVLQHQRGNQERALGLLRHALEIVPDAPGVWNNLGNVLLRLNESEDAEHAFRRSIELTDSPEAQANLSRVLRRRGQWGESEAACRRAIEINPDFGDAWHNLSLTLLRQDRVLEGIAAANKALILLPPHKRRRDSYARALVLAGQVEQAAAIFRDWLAEEPDNAYVQHHLAACTGDRVPERASDAYVERVFDNFASTFDKKLATLRYRAPQLVADALAAVLPAPAHQFDVADIGCGTGLCGPLVQAWARRITGCDLSGAMLDQARQRNVYDVLEKAELVQFLEGHPNCFDLVISADTLCYFGNLQAVANAARSALRAGGQFVFTVEALKEADEDTYRLLANGRYAHALAYVQSVLDAADLRPQRIVGEVLREEVALPVHGWLVTASRAL
jgi:predicted TPR repeat methyltransferase